MCATDQIIMVKRRVEDVMLLYVVTELYCLVHCRCAKYRQDVNLTDQCRWYSLIDFWFLLILIVNMFTCTNTCTLCFTCYISCVPLIYLAKDELQSWISNFVDLQCAFDTINSNAGTPCVVILPHMQRSSFDSIQFYFCTYIRIGINQTNLSP